MMDRAAIKERLEVLFPIAEEDNDKTPAFVVEPVNGLLQRARSNASVNQDKFRENISWQLLEELFGADTLKKTFPEFPDDGNMDDLWHLLHANSDSVISVDELICECFGEVYIDPDDANEVYHIYRDQEDFMPVDAVGDAIRALGFNPTEAEVQLIANQCDENGDGFIEPDEWQQILKTLKLRFDVRTDARENFDIVAKEGSSIPTQELIYLAQNLGMGLGPSELAGMLEIVDSNRDGEVQYEELLPMLHKIQGP